MSTTPPGTLYRTLVKSIAFAAVMVAVLWLLYKSAGVLLLVMFALVLALVINAPVSYLEKRRGINRAWACAIVFGIIVLVMVLLTWLIVPVISKQLTLFVNNLPSYANNLSNNVASWFRKYPEINKDIQKQGISLSNWVPSVPKTLMSIGNYSISIVSFVLIFIFFCSMVVYAVTNPKPLLHTYFSLFPAAKQEKATEALVKSSTMLIGWFKANLIGGTIRAVCVTLFLSWMNVPAAMVWGVLTFFSELVPKLGFYIMAIPTLLMALSVGPYTALWVLIFLIVLDEIMGDIILPRLRSRTMNIHPVSTFFILLVMASAFGVAGVLLATPLTAIIKAYYEVFFNEQQQNARKSERLADRVLYGERENKSPITD
jgi:predicted PurR-regulated permease PerM